MALRKLNVQLGLNTQGFSSGLKSAGKDLKDFNKDIKSADKGAASLSSGLGKLTKSAAKIAASTITIKALTRATKAAFNAYLVFESSMIRSHDVFRDSNKYIKYFAENTAKAFGMSESAAYQYAAVYGNLFKAVTKDTEENAKVTIAMLKASAVIASKTGRTTEDVMERLRSGILGNTEAIEDLGIYAQVGMVKTSEAFKKVAKGKSWEQLTFQQQQQIRILSYLEQAHSQFGDTVANTSAFSLQTLAGAFKNLTSYAGAFVNAGLQPIIRGLTQLVTWATAGVKALASLFGLELKFADTGATEAATAAQDDLTDAIEKTAKAKRGLAGFDKINQISSSSGGSSGGVSAGAGGGVFDGIAMPEFEIAETHFDWVDKAKTNLSGLTDFINSVFAPSISAWGESFSKLKEPALKAFGSIQKTTKTLWKETLKPFGSYIVSDWVPNIANSFSSTFAPIFGDVMPVLFDEFALDFEFASLQVSRAVNDILKPSFELLSTIASDVFSSISKSWNTYGSNILKGFQNFKASLRTIWESLYSTIFKPIITNIGEMFSWLWDKHLKGLWDNIVDFAGSFTEMIYNIWNSVLAPLIKLVVSIFGPSISRVFSYVGDVVGSVFGIISDVIGGVIKVLSGLCNFVSGVLTLNWRKAWEGIKKIFGGVWGSFSGVIKGAVNMWIDLINHFIRKINGFKITIPAWLSAIPGIGQYAGKNLGFNIATIPKLAEGGVVTSPTYALIGEAGSEAVMPLERNTGWIDQLASKLNSKDGGGDIYLTEHIYLDSGELINSFTKKINRESRKNNKPILAV